MSLTKVLQVQENTSNKRKVHECEVTNKKCKIESTNISDGHINASDDDDDDDEEIIDDNENTSEIKCNTNNDVQCDKEKIDTEIICPKYGQIVNRRNFRRAGPYIIGTKLGYSPVDSIVQYLAKRENTNEFVQLKILMLGDDPENEKMLQDERQGKMLLHTEFSLLSLLENQDGVIQHRGMFSDMAFEEHRPDSGSNDIFYTGKLRKRLVLVLDCVTAHDFDTKSSAYINLQQYLINRKKLPELEALKIFYEIICIVENLHKRNIIHRDLKLGNIILNKYTNKVTIINFCLGKYLVNENDLLYDQRGSPAYISPDVLCGKPYKGKPSDMWALGVVLFMMLYRQFPFFESTPTALFKKIKSAEYVIPLNSEISPKTEEIIKGLLQLSPERRITASQVKEKLNVLINASVIQNTDGVVPELVDDEEIQRKVSSARQILKTRHSIKRGFNFNQRDQVVPTVSSTNQSSSSSSSKSPIVSAITASLSSSLSLTPPSSSTSTSSNRAHKRARSLPLSPARNGFQRPPNTISVEHVGTDARQLSPSDIGQFRFLIQSNQPLRRNSRDNLNNLSPSNRPRNTDNPAAPQSTRQLNGFLLRSRLRSPISGLQRSHTAIPNLNGDRSQLTSDDIINNNSFRINRMNGTINNIDNYSRYLNRLYRNAMALRTNHQAQQRTQGATLNRIDIRYITHHNRGPRPNRHSTGSIINNINSNTSNSSNHSTTLPLSTSPMDLHRTQRAQIILSESIKILFDTFNEMFIRGRIPNQNAENLLNFNGVITEELANKINAWLTRSPEYRYHSVIQRFFISSREISSVNRVVEFLRRCGIVMETMNGTTKIRREQTLDLIMIMTYLLQAAGYNNSYFIAN